MITWLVIEADQDILPINILSKFGDDQIKQIEGYG